jgi:hypothetical protein
MQFQLPVGRKSRTAATRANPMASARRSGALRRNSCLINEIEPARVASLVQRRPDEPDLGGGGARRSHSAALRGRMKGAH